MCGIVKEVEDRGFAEAVAKGVVLVDLWAPRCGPCRLQGPILDDVARVVGGKAAIVKVNIDENPMVADAFSFKSIPTLILLRDGEVKLQLTGLQRKETLVSAIAEVAGV